MIFIIEHLEPRLYKWCFLEYQHISQLVGKENLWFTNIKSPSQRKKLATFGKVFPERVHELSFSKVCVLDPAAEKILAPQDAQKFDFFVFGGILGDYPPRKRTEQELTIMMKNTATRNLGKEQLPTDNAVFAAQEILHGKKFSELKFIDGMEIPMKKSLSMHLPFRYVLLEGKPLMSEKLLEYVKKKKGF